MNQLTARLQDTVEFLLKKCTVLEETINGLQSSRNSPQVEIDQSQMFNSVIAIPHLDFIVSKFKIFISGSPNII